MELAVAGPVRVDTYQDGADHAQQRRHRRQQADLQVAERAQALDDQRQPDEQSVDPDERAAEQNRQYPYPNVADRIEHRVLPGAFDLGPFDTQLSLDPVALSWREK